MQIINIEEYDEEVVLHFGGERKKINAYTLASSLVSIADAERRLGVKSIDNSIYLVVARFIVNEEMSLC